MSRYIDADALLQKLSRMIDYCKKDTKVNGLNALFQVGDAIMDCPTADVVEVVRDIFNDLNELWHKGRGFINYSDLVRLERLHEQKYTEDGK